MSPEVQKNQEIYFKKAPKAQVKEKKNKVPLQQFLQRHALENVLWDVLLIFYDVFYDLICCQCKFNFIIWEVLCFIGSLQSTQDCHQGFDESLQDSQVIFRSHEAASSTGKKMDAAKSETFSDPYWPSAHCEKKLPYLRFYLWHVWCGVALLENLLVITWFQSMMFSTMFCCTIWVALFENLLVKVLKIPLESPCGHAALLEDSLVKVLNIPVNSFFQVALLVNLLVEHLNVSVK